MARLYGKCVNLFYEIKVQSITTKTGIPISFHFTAGKAADVKALNKILDKLPTESSLCGDSAYTDYETEYELFNNMAFSSKRNAERIVNTLMINKIAKKHRCVNA